MKETLFWLSQPRIHEDLAEAEADIAAGRVYDEAQVRQALNLRATLTHRLAPRPTPAPPQAIS